MKKRSAFLLLPLLILLAFCTSHAADPTYIFKEAEDFEVVKGDWEAKPWGTNYYAATFANSFLSRMAYLGSPEQGVAAEAVAEIDVPVADTYMVLARYEAAYRFETQFGIKIEQNGEVVFDTLYGARENPKVWFFYTKIEKKLHKEYRLPWGPVENIVWEGTEYKVNLQPGKARITLYKGEQPELAARRNVDIIMLTNDDKGIQNRLENERYLPLDGLMTQQGDLFVKIKNNPDSPAPILLKVRTLKWQEHSPYQVHLREWQPKMVGTNGEGADPEKDEDWLQPGQESPFVEIGSLVDSLNDCQLTLVIKTKAKDDLADCTVTLASPDKDGNLEVIRVLSRDEFSPVDKEKDGTPIVVLPENTTEAEIEFHVPGNIRVEREIPTVQEALDKLVKTIEAFPKKGKAPDLILFHPNYTWFPPTAPILKALGNNSSDNKNAAGENVPEILETTRKVPDLDKWYENLKEKGLDHLVRVISLGDEIGIPSVVPGPENTEKFRAYLKDKGLTPADLGVKDWDEVDYIAPPNEHHPIPEDPHIKVDNALVYYYSNEFNNIEGPKPLKRLTDFCRERYPNVYVGANYSPHSWYWPTARKYVNAFRDEVMTMPWTEDYIWQVPVTSQQLLGYLVDACRAGAKYHDQPIYMYLMTHSYGNTPNGIRRAFYSDIARGVTFFNYFAHHPPTMITENTVREESIDHYKVMHDLVRETGLFEDIIYYGKVRQAETAILISESSEMWYRTPVLNAERQHIWMALKGEQVPVDFLTEYDITAGYIDDYKVLYVCEPCINEDASKALVEWVNKGGTLFATSGAAMRDQLDQPNETLRGLFGVAPGESELHNIPAFQGKDHLPFLKPLDIVLFGEVEMPIYMARQKFELRQPENSYEDVAKFKSGGNAAVVRKVGEGYAAFFGFMPGASYVKPAIPVRPCDRGATDDAFSHFIPTDFDETAKGIILAAVQNASVDRPVQSSVPLVEVSRIEAEMGIAITLINWTKGAIDELVITVKDAGDIKTVSLASEIEPRWEKQDDNIVITMPLNAAADLIMLRR